MIEEHIASPGSPSLPSPWEIPNPFRNMPPCESSSLASLDEFSCEEVGEPRWDCVHSSIPHIVHRDLDVDGRAQSAAVHYMTSAGIETATAPPPREKGLLHTVRRARSQQPVRSFEVIQGRKLAGWPEVRCISLSVFSSPLMCTYSLPCNPALLHL